MRKISCVVAKKNAPRAIYPSLDAFFSTMAENLFGDESAYEGVTGSNSIHNVLFGEVIHFYLVHLINIVRRHLLMQDASPASPNN